MERFTWACFLILMLGSCGHEGGSPMVKAQNQEVVVGGPFENRDFIFDGIPEQIMSVDTSDFWYEDSNRILISGIVYGPDGETPMPGVIIYYYQTDSKGVYVHRDDIEDSMVPNSLGQTHGWIRGWMQTDSSGRYQLYTSRPGTYPSRAEPAHIHLTIKEPNNLSPYYIDDIVFDDDALLNSEKRRSLSNRAGSGIVRLFSKDNLTIGERDIILGLNIPDHPSSERIASEDGPSRGDDLFSFTPYHVWGPDRGTKVCPICKYGWYSGALFFIDSTLSDEDLKSWSRFFENQSIERKGHLKTYFVFAENNSSFSRADLEKVGEEMLLENVALTTLPSFQDTSSHIDDYNLPPGRNTMILYRRSGVEARILHTVPSENQFQRINDILDRSENEYFFVPRPRYED